MYCGLQKTTNHYSIQEFFPSPTKVKFGPLGDITALLLRMPFCFVLFCLFMAAPTAYGSSQARVLMGAAAAGLPHIHSNEGSKLHL